MLWGVGPKTAEKLEILGVRKIGELAQIDEIDLLRRFGKHGYDLVRRAKGIDKRSIVTQREAKSISQERTYSKDTRDEGKLRQTIEKQSQNVSRRLQKKGLTARTVKIKLRWHDFETLTRQATLNQPTDDGEIIANTAKDLFSNTWKRERLVRLVGVGVSGFEVLPKQLGLWDTDWEKETRIQSALNELKERYGEDVLSRGMPEEE
jgi:DNA polymerase-4